MGRGIEGMRNPVYAKVYEALKKEITDGEYMIGQLLPPEPELEKKFEVSRTTVRKAVELLVRDGFVKVRQGRGTEVVDYRTKQNLNAVTSISETLRKKGIDVRPKSIYIDVVTPSNHIAQELGLKPEEKVARIQRIQLADGRPLAIMKNYIPYHLVPGIERYVNDIVSLYKFMREQYGICIDSGHDRISAKVSNFYESEVLQVPVGTALLYMKRVCYAEEKPVCTDRLSIIGERYELEVNMIGRNEV